jgi:2-oxoglutarate dehydrogenase E1 component
MRMAKLVSSYLYSGNAWFIEDLYESFLHNPASIDPQWQACFKALQEDGPAIQKDVPHTPIQRAYAEATKHKGGIIHTAVPAANAISHQKQAAVLQIINAHRFLGHRQADLDPLKQYVRPDVPELNPGYHGLTEADMDNTFSTGSLFAADEITLREILEIVKTTYCHTIGAEYMHINETEQKRWIQNRLETTLATPNFSNEKKHRILDRVIAANALEEYLHTKYVGQKRFSLEGGESLIPLLDELIQSGGIGTIKEIVIGMAHRGRVNVLVNTIGKLPSNLFDEFEGKAAEDMDGSGDVKYHLGFSSDIHTPGGSVHLTLAFNPSHLEIIDPVVEGSVRARQERRQDHARDQILPVLIHGDAAFAGQGVVMETFNLSQTRGYTTGGTIHIIINNQIGFTTSDPLDSRSTLYCTDVAKMMQAPIFHVNGDDPEAVVFIAKLALDYRMEFKKDVVIDMVCYRKHGHSEADEPAATQPIMYKQIRNHPGGRSLYTEKLKQENIITDDDVQKIAGKYIESLEANRAVAGTRVEHANPEYLIDYSIFKGTLWYTVTDTALDKDTVMRLNERITTLPDSFKLHPAVNKVIESRRKMGQREMRIDWGYAENMAYASLLDQGYPIRISGQDSGRGTFFHRHAVLHNQDDGTTYLVGRGRVGL